MTNDWRSTSAPNGLEYGSASGAPNRADEYVSRFRSWDSRASVRTKPMRRLDGGATGTVFFPPELARESGHPSVKRLGQHSVERLLVHRLYQYLDFTSELEMVTVIPVTTAIARQRSGLSLSGEMRSDAFKIATDEAWHAQFSNGLIEQLELLTGVRRLLGEHAFVARLSAISARLDITLRGAASLLFAVCSETLISAILSDMPHDLRLPYAVRETIRDHAEDEGRHHAYFRSVLTHFWPSLTPSERRCIGPLVPDVLKAFLEPDLIQIQSALISVGLTPDEAARVAIEAYPESYVSSLCADAAQPTVRYLTELGALNDPETKASFGAAGLLTRP